jgi:NDP-sugar pyrophosphorylase family protein
MALVAGVPFLQLLIERLRSDGVQEIILGTGYMGDLIENHFAGGDNLGICIRYSRERKPLGTGGAVKLAESQLSDPVLILNGDSYAEWRLGPILELMVSRNADLVMVLQKVGEVTRYGSVTVDDDNRVTQFVEKGRRHGGGLINAGVYLLRAQTLLAGLARRQASAAE